MSQSSISSGKILKRNIRQKNKKRLRRAAKSMLRVMETPGECTHQDVVSEFLGTGRTGRRNALPDILGPNAQTSCSDLPDRMETLCSVAKESTASDLNQTAVAAGSNNITPSSSSHQVAPTPAPNS